MKFDIGKTDRTFLYFEFANAAGTAQAFPHKKKAGKITSKNRILF
ncbi:hypothetical protein [Roseibium aggregatum]|nr:hypothetical protein [Roseibium aggregatum]